MMKKTLIAAICVSTLLIAAPTSNYSVSEWIKLNQRIITLTEEANLDFNQGNYQSALTAYQEIVGYNPDDLSIQNKQTLTTKALTATQLIEKQYAQSAYTETLTNIKNLESLNPNDTTYQPLAEKIKTIQQRQINAQTLYKKGDYNQAIEQYEKILAVHPEDKTAPALINKNHKIIESKKQAIQQFNNGNYKQARDIYQNILSANAEDPAANQAITQCTSALQYITQADNSISKSDFSTAFALLQKVVDINPNDATAYKRTVDYKQIIDYYQINAPLLQQSQYDGIVANYELMLKILEDNPKLTNELRRYKEAARNKDLMYDHFAEERYSEALAIAKKVISSNPSDSLISRNSAICSYATTLEQKGKDLYRQGNYQQSLAVYKKLADIRLIKQTPINLGAFSTGEKATITISDFSDETKLLLKIQDKTYTLYRNDQGWSTIITLPKNLPLGYHAATISTIDDQPYPLPAFFILEVKKVISAPTGYSTTEQDLAL